MKPFAVAVLVAATALPAFGQYSARQLTRKVVPPAQQSPPPQPPQYQPAAPQGVAPRPAIPAANTAKAQAEKARNEAKQLEFYKRRAEEGSDHAQYELGMRYLTGKGVAQDQKLARQWLEKAAKQGHTQAATRLKELGPAPVETSAPAPASTAAKTTTDSK